MKKSFESYRKKQIPPARRNDKAILGYWMRDCGGGSVGGDGGAGADRDCAGGWD